MNIDHLCHRYKCKGQGLLLPRWVQAGEFNFIFIYFKIPFISWHNPSNLVPDGQIQISQFLKELCPNWTYSKRGWLDRVCPQSYQIADFCIAFQKYCSFGRQEWLNLDTLWKNLSWKLCKLFCFANRNTWKGYVAYCSHYILKIGPHFVQQLCAVCAVHVV